MAYEAILAEALALWLRGRLRRSNTNAKRALPGLLRRNVLRPPERVPLTLERHARCIFWDLQSAWSGSAC